MLLVSDTALLGEATDVFLYALTVAVVTDLDDGKQTIHYTAELLTNSTLEEVGSVSGFDNIVSVTSEEPLDHVDGLLGVAMDLVEIDATGNVDYQQALYSLLTRIEN